MNQPAAKLDPRRVLADSFGYPEFRPLQGEVVDRLMGGGSALLLMPTGGGKSLCYQIPSICRPGTGLVISPLVSLMEDQVVALRQAGVAAAALHSGLEAEETRAIRKQLFAGELDLLYLSPEKVMQEQTLRELEEVSLALLAIDEAHCISQWGHDFRPEYRQLASLRERWPALPLLACTATADGPTRRDIAAQLGIATDDVVVGGFDRPNLKFTVVDKHGGRQQLLRFIKAEHANDAGIVYCASRKKTEATAEALQKEGIRALAYHAGLSSSRRSEVLRVFQLEEDVVVVATIAFGMGIDKSNVRFVAHFDIPKSLEAYYQEVGRAGRDGLPASAWMSYGLGDVVAARRLLIGDGPADSEHQRISLRKLDQLVGFCEGTACRRQMVLGYFGEEHPGRCGNCDNCLDPPTTWDATEAAQKLLSCVARSGQRFGQAHVVDILLGKESEKIQRFGHDSITTFGIGKDLDEARWRSLARQLVAHGFLGVDVEGYGALQLNEKSWSLLRSECELHARHERKTAKTKTKKTASAAASLDGDSQSLFERLRALRMELAKDQGVPPYVIFHDKTLVAMAAEQPASLEAMGELPGVGAKKLERYGTTFLSAIRE